MYYTLDDPFFREILTRTTKCCVLSFPNVFYVLSIRTYYTLKA